MRIPALLALTIACAPAATVDLNWNDNTESDLSHYRVYSATSANVALTSGNRLADNVTASAWSYANAPAGDRWYVVTAVDQAGNESPKSNEIKVTVPTTNAAPTCAITAPANNANVTINTAVTITATASDSDGTIAKVEFWKDGAMLGEDTASPYSFVWTPIATGISQLVCKAIDDDGAVGTSATISVNKVDGGGLPSGWSAGDIGSVATVGATARDGSGVWTLSASGADIWGKADEFHFASQAASGDTTIVAKVVTLSNTNSWAKAGVMLRDGTAAGARHGSLFVTPGSGVAFQYRATAGGGSSHVAGSTAKAPRWLRMQRVGNACTGSESADGSAWAAIRTQTVTMPTAIRAGLALTSHKDGTLATATFSNVAVTTAPAVVN